MRYIAAFLSFYIVWFVVAFIISIVVAVLFPANGPIAAGVVFSPDWRTWPGMGLGFIAGIYAAKCVYKRIAPASNAPMTTLKAAAICLIAYAIIFSFDVLVRSQQLGSVIYWNRILTYVPVALILSWGLWQAKRWAWVSSLLLTAVFGAMGLLLLFAGVYISNSNLEEARPWVLVDWFSVILMDIALVATFILLLLPSSKQALQEVTQTSLTTSQNVGDSSDELAHVEKPRA